jgi:hypothetical protein
VKLVSGITRACPRSSVLNGSREAPKGGSEASSE